MNYSKVMNQQAAVFQLSELKDHIDTIIEEIVNGDYNSDGDLSYQVGLSHLYDHLNRAWHFSKLTDDQINALDQESFERTTYSIPKLDGNFRIVEADALVK
ncbi:MAG: hypothetical protein ABJH08_05980 [Balneola sp.]